MALAAPPAARKLDHTLAAILAHPLRCRCMAILAGRVASPNQLSREFGEPLGNVSYHVRCLEELGAIELVDTKQRRGAVEHFYRATELPVLSNEESGRMTVAERQEVIRISLQLLTASAGVALSEGTFGARPDDWLVRVPAVVDEQGWGELGEAFAEVYDRVFAIVADSAERLNGNPEAESIPVVAGLTFFEVPPDSGGGSEAS